MRTIIIFFAILWLFAGCEEISFENYEKRTYYDVIGEGYVYCKDTKEPASNARVAVQSSFKSDGWATVQPIWEDFPVDSAGYFRVKFLKRTHKENVIYYYIFPSADTYYYTGEAYPDFTAEELRGKKGIVQVDTLW
ncbi:MAG: pollen Ole e 1 allergen/extensin family protein, partial [Bacteroidales bacterium]|nr:pollen Ole e 1 allergen/extensin family protein [Bacteroidales bacterium]